MSKPQFLTPWTVTGGQQQQTTITADEYGGERSNYPRSPIYNSPTTRIESTVSIGTSEQIQQHLDSGNAIYFGVDPRDCNRIRRDTTQCTEFLAKRLQRFQRVSGSDDDDVGKSLLSKILCGLPLDSMTKITLVVGLYLGTHLCITGTTSFLAKRVNRQGLSFLVAVLKIVWGTYFSGVCIFGMSLMWGKFRRSPTAALIFTIIWTFTTFIILVSAGLFFYFFHSARSAQISNCRASTVRAGPRRWGDSVHFNPEAPRRSAPKDRIEACIARTMTRGIELLVYAIAHMFVALMALVVIAWARDYRKRLRTVEEFKQLQERYQCEDEKVGLVIGTAPIGRRVPMTTSPLSGRNIPFGCSNSNLPPRSSLSEKILPATPSPRAPASRPRTSLMDMFGVLSISVRRSELYAAGPSPLPSPRASPMPPPLAMVREEGSVVSNVRVL